MRFCHYRKWLRINHISHAKTISSSIAWSALRELWNQSRSIEGHRTLFASMATTHQNWDVSNPSRGSIESQEHIFLDHVFRYDYGIEMNHCKADSTTKRDFWSMSVVAAGKERGPWANWEFSIPIARKIFRRSLLKMMANKHIVLSSIYLYFIHYFIGYNYTIIDNYNLIFHRIKISRVFIEINTHWKSTK